MDSEELKKNDLANQLEKMLSGTEFDKKFEAKFDEMERLGMTEDQIMDQLMGTMPINLANSKQSKNGQEQNFNPQDLQMNEDLMREFDKVMQDSGAKEEIESMFEQMQNHADQKAQSQNQDDESDQDQVIELGEGDDSQSNK